MSVGTDIEQIDRFRRLDRKDHTNFFDRIFTKKELAYCFSKNDAAPHLAARFAGKEATLKALTGLGFKNIDYKGIAISQNKAGFPEVQLDQAKFNDLSASLSLSHCEDRALAFVVMLNQKEKS